MTCVTKNEVNCNFLARLDTTLSVYAYDFEFGIKDLCEVLTISRTSLHRKVTTCSGKSTSIYIRDFRLSKALEFLKSTSRPIRDITYSVGFSDIAYFSRCFKERYGASPSEIRKKYKK